MSTAPVDDRPPWSNIPRGRPFVHADLEAMPDDGRRYEIIDGVLIVTPAPSTGHQRAARNLFLVLHAASPGPQWEVFFAPLDVRLSDSTLEPDILVAKTARFTEKNLPEAPTLAVEILSPSTRRLDLTLKRARYEADGTPAYWVVDPSPDDPSVRAWHLRGNTFVEVANVHGNDRFSTEIPYPVTITPSSLVRS